MNIYPSQKTYTNRNIFSNPKEDHLLTLKDKLSSIHQQTEILPLFYTQTKSSQLHLIFLEHSKITKEILWKKILPIWTDFTEWGQEMLKEWRKYMGSDNLSSQILMTSTTMYLRSSILCWKSRKIDMGSGWKEARNLLMKMTRITTEWIKFWRG